MFQFFGGDGNFPVEPEQVLEIVGLVVLMVQRYYIF